MRDAVDALTTEQVVAHARLQIERDRLGRRIAPDPRHERRHPGVLRAAGEQQRRVVAGKAELEARTARDERHRAVGLAEVRLERQRRVRRHAVEHLRRVADRHAGRIGKDKLDVRKAGARREAALVELLPGIATAVGLGERGQRHAGRKALQHHVERPRDGGGADVRHREVRIVEAGGRVEDRSGAEFAHLARDVRRDEDGVVRHRRPAGVVVERDGGMENSARREAVGVLPGNRDGVAGDCERAGPRRAVAPIDGRAVAARSGLDPARHRERPQRQRSGRNAREDAVGDRGGAQHHRRRIDDGRAALGGDEAAAMVLDVHADRQLIRPRVAVRPAENVEAVGELDASSSRCNHGSDLGDDVEECRRPVGPPLDRKVFRGERVRNEG
jgi:hypothetical protein